MSRDIVQELFELVESCGGTIKLYGKPMTVQELRTFAWSGWVEKYVDVVVRAACTALVVPLEPEWSPYPVGNER